MKTTKSINLSRKQFSGAISPSHKFVFIDKTRITGEERQCNALPPISFTPQTIYIYTVHARQQSRKMTWLKCQSSSPLQSPIHSMVLHKKISKQVKLRFQHNYQTMDRSNNDDNKSRFTYTIIHTKVDLKITTA